MKKALLVLLLVTASAGLAFSADTGNLHVRAFRQDITPEHHTQLNNLWKQSFEAVHDKICARALVLYNGTTSAPVVAVDTVEFFDATPLVQRVARRIIFAVQLVERQFPFR